MKKSLLAIALLFSTSEIVKAIDSVDVVIATVVIATSIMMNNHQQSELEIDAALYPEQKNIYEAVDMGSYHNTTYLFSGLSIAGLITCRFLGLPPVLTNAALTATAVSAGATYQKRTQIERIAQMDRIKKQSKE